MARTPEQLADKWDAGFIEAIDDAKGNYDSSLPGAATKLKTKATVMAAAYKTKVESQAWKDAVDAAFDPSTAGTAYSQRLDQIKVTGLTDFQKAKVELMIKVRRQIATHLTDVRDTLKGATSTGDAQFKTAYKSLNDKLLNFLTNRLLIAVSDDFDESTSLTAMLAALKAHLTDSEIGTYLEAKS